MGKERRKAKPKRREEPVAAPSPVLGPAWRALDFLGLAALVALAVAWASWPLAHDDLFGHLRTGEWIVQNGKVPLTDPFSFTRLGTRWISHEWGFSLLTWAVERLGGLTGLMLLRVLIVLAIGGALAWRMRTETETRSFPWTAGLLALGLWAVAWEMILRAALLSELFLAVTMLLLAGFRKTGDRRFLYALPGLFLLWGNVHSGVIFGLYVLGLFVLEALLRKRPWHPCALAFGGAALASLINPNGWQVWLYPFKLSQVLFGSGIEWQLGHFAAAGPWGNVAFVLMIGLLGIGLLSGRWRELSWAEIVAVLTFAGLSFRTPRFVFHFSILALPAVYRMFAGRPRSLQTLLRAAVPAVAAWAAVAVWMDHPRRLLDPKFPEGAVRWLEREGVQGRIFNHQNYGGFLSWRARVPVFWDGRNDVFASLAREVTTVPFSQTVERYGVDALLITDFEDRGVQPWVPAQWGLVYWDDFSALYLRRDRFGSLLSGKELRMFPAFGGRPGLKDVAADPAQAAAARAELDGILALWPENQRALFFRGRLRRYQGDPEGARRDLEAALAVRDSDVVREELAAVGGP